MPAYLPMWLLLHAGEAALCLLWLGMSAAALRSGRRLDALILATLSALGTAWVGAELVTVASGQLVGDVPPATRVEAASLFGLAALTALRPGRPGRSLMSLFPLALAVQGLAGIVAGITLAARGVLDDGARARRWALAAVLLLAVAGGVRAHDLSVRLTLAETFGLSSDEGTIAAEWVADASTLAAWASAAGLLARSDPSPLPDRQAGPPRGWARDESTTG